MNIDINKKYRTKDGREVRIYATDHVGVFEVFGAIKSSNGWFDESWTKEGFNLSDGIPTDLDLIEVVQKEELLEEAKRRYPEGVMIRAFDGRTRLLHAKSKGVFGVREHGKGITIWCDTSSGKTCVYTEVHYPEPKWAQVVKVYEVDVLFYEGLDGIIATEARANCSANYIAKKKITFYKGEGL